MSPLTHETEKRGNGAPGKPHSRFFRKPRRAYLALAMSVVLALPTPATAQEVRPFASGSLARIVESRDGRPFILAFWSLTCSHCQEEFALFGKLLHRHPKLDLVLVSTDMPEDSETIHATLEKSGLAKAEAWVFADSFAERLRFEVDNKWHGELPRAYFYAPGEARRAVSGKVAENEIKHWIERHVR